MIKSKTTIRLLSFSLLFCSILSLILNNLTTLAQTTNYSSAIGADTGINYFNATLATGNSTNIPRNAKVDVDSLNNQYYLWQETVTNSTGNCDRLFFAKYSATGVNTLPKVDITNIFNENPCSANNQKTYQDFDLAVDYNGNAYIAYRSIQEWGLGGSNIMLVGIPRNKTNFTNTNGLIITSVNQSTGSNTAGANHLNLSVNKYSNINNGFLALAFDKVDNDNNQGLNSYLALYQFNFVSVNQNNDSIPSSSPTLIINTKVNLETTNTNEYKPRVSWAGNNSGLVMWQGPTGLFGRAFNSTGTLSTVININSSGNNPDLAGVYRSNPSGSANLVFYTVWDGAGSGDNQGVYGKKITCDTITTCIPESYTARINNSTNGQQSNPRIAASSNRNFNSRASASSSDTYASDYFTVSWIDQSDTLPKLMSQNFIGRFGHINGTKTIASIIVDTNEDNNPDTSPIIQDYTYDLPDLAMNLDGDATFTYKPNNTPYNYNTSIYATELYKLGTAFQPHNPVNTQESASVDIGANGNLATVYAENDGTNMYDIKLSLYDSNGSSIIQSYTVNTSQTGDHKHPQVKFFHDSEASVHYGKFMVVWTDYYLGQISYQLFNADGTPIGGNQLATTITIDGDDTIPSLGTGLYDTFVIAWKDDSVNDVRALYQYGATKRFFQNDIDTDTQPQVILKQNADGAINSEMMIVFRYFDLIQGLFLNLDNNTLSQAGFVSVATLPAPYGPYTEYGQGDFFHEGGDDYFLVAYEQTLANGHKRVEMATLRFGYSTVLARTLLDYPLPVPGTISYSPSVSINPDSFNGIISWTMSTDNIQQSYTGTPSFNNNIMVQPIQRDDSEEPFTLFGPYFSINNNKPSGLKLIFNSASFGQYGAIAYQTINAIEGDDYGIFIQKISDPFTGILQNQSLQPLTNQQITAGGKLLAVPNDFSFGNIGEGGVSTINTSTLSLINDSGTAQAGGIRITDLDGTPFSLTVSMTSLVNTTTNNPAHILPNSAVSIKNNDNTSPSVQSNNAFTAMTDIILDASTNNFNNLDSTRTIATKTNNNTGEWKIYPSLQLTLPSDGVENGNYSGTLTFTLI